MTVHLRYAIRRVHCLACRRVKTEQVPWADASCNFTHAFEERVAYLAQQSSRTAVSELLRVAWRTVGAIIGRVVHQRLDAGEDRLDGLRHIGIDELSYRRHHEYITVVVDHERGVVVWSERGKNADTLRTFFDELGPDRCAKIESVTIDMSAAYIRAVQDKVPKAKLIFDRFHGSPAPLVGGLKAGMASKRGMQALRGRGGLPGRSTTRVRGSDHLPGALVFRRPTTMHGPQQPQTASGARNSGFFPRPLPSPARGRGGEKPRDLPLNGSSKELFKGNADRVVG
jgi:hypothetical protein